MIEPVRGSRRLTNREAKGNQPGPMASKSTNTAEVTEQTIRLEETYSGWITAQGHRAWKVAEYSSLYLAMLAMMEVYIVIVLLSLPTSPAPIVAGLLTFAIYTNDRLVDVDADESANPGRTAFIRQYSDELYVLTALSYGVAAVIALTGGPLAFGLTLLPAAVWILYAIDWANNFTTSFGRLKEFLILNSVLVAAAWSVTIVLLPVAFADRGFTASGAVILLFFIVATFVTTEIANLGDVDSDRQTGVSTMPTTFGVVRTRQYLSAVTVSLAALPGIAVVLGLLSMVYGIALSLGVISTLCVTMLVGRTDNSDRLAIVAEFTRVPVFIVLVVLSVAG